MIGCLRTRVRKQPIIALYFDSENELKFYNIEAWSEPLLVAHTTLLEISCHGSYVDSIDIDIVSRGEDSINDKTFWHLAMIKSA